MENRIFYSKVNPYVGARYPVHCSCCDSEVKPAMTIERGYEVQAVSLVEAVAPTNKTKPLSTLTITEADAIKFNTNANEFKAMKLARDTSYNSGVAIQESKTMTPTNVTVKEAEVEGNRDETKTVTSMGDGIEKATTNTLNEFEPMVQENYIDEAEATVKDNFNDEAETKVKENCIIEQSDEEVEWSNADEVQTTCMIPPSVFRRIRLALNKARFCLQKINCTTSKRFQELSQEENQHVEAIKTIAMESLATEDSNIDELCLVSTKLIKTMEHLKMNMLDCQQKSLLDIIDTLKQDVEAELLSLDQNDVQEKENECDETVETSMNDSIMTFITDTPWTLFGFISLCVANLGYFSQPWIFQTFRTSFVRYLGF